MANPEIIKVYAQDLPALRLIGKKYGDADRQNGGFGHLWHQFFVDGSMQAIENAVPFPIREIYEDGDAYLGFMRMKEGEPFEYWIGLFTPAGTAVPQGFASLDLPAARLGVCWLHGTTPEVFGKEHLCAEKLEEQGYTLAQEADGAYLFFERYGCPRFTNPDEQGNLILDIGWYIKP